MSDSPEVSSVELSAEAVISPEVTEASQPYIGEWNQLVSTTNWEKGRIIVAWRAALIDSGAPASEYADEAWATLVGGVTGQHVGRLRRVAQRFGQSYKNYPGLYWSHFQAALDWEDAEMWLEGAVQSGWSVSQMRKQRRETMGAVAADAPQAEDEVSSELDEDFEPAQHQDPVNSSLSPEYSEIAAGPLPEGPDFGDEGEPNAADEEEMQAADEAWAEGEAEEETASAPVERVRPFEGLSDLPDDVLDAVESFKLLILKHRRNNWEELPQEHMVAALEALKQLALAPADEEASAPF
jgi:hypothetical protein